MKTLEITMLVKTNSIHEAEKIAAKELFELAKRSGSNGSGGGNATYEADGMYRVDANVEIGGACDINNVIKETQSAWAGKSTIISSMILVHEEEKEKKNQVECSCCGNYFNESDICYVNPNTPDEYALCHDCFVAGKDIVECDQCGAYLDGMNGEYTVVNGDTSNDYILCDECYEKEALKGNIVFCKECGEFRDNLIENPVTHERNLCPICGANLQL